MDDAIRMFYKALDTAESLISKQLLVDKDGIVLKSALVELDLQRYRFVRGGPSSDVEATAYYLMKLGVARMIKISLGAHEQFTYPVFNCPHDRNRAAIVVDMAMNLGVVEHGRRVAQAAQAGSCDVVLERDEFLIRRRPGVFDDAFHECELSHAYAQEHRNAQKSLLRLAERFGVTKKVRRLLRELVRPFREIFIGYDADPVLDAYFHGLALSELQGAEGFDSFHYSLQFGGVSYSNYMQGLKYTLSCAFKHQAFSEALIAKDKKIRLGNVLNVMLDSEPYIAGMRDSINEYGSMYEGHSPVSMDDARRIFKVLSVGRSSLSMVDRPGCALPPIVRFSDSAFLRCLPGAYESPVQFLLDSLRHHFPADYDRNQLSRETSFQLASRRVLAAYLPDLHFCDNVSLKVNGETRTDVDFAVADPSSGVLLLCQLKHQELYGNDLYAKHLRTSRLNAKVDQWFASTGEWLETASQASLRETFRIPRHFPEVRVRRMVLAKHYGFSLRATAERHSALYANWLQFCNAIEKSERSSDRTLEGLLEAIAAAVPSESVEYADDPVKFWRAGNLRFSVESRV
jgi:hypothetical protein